MNYLKKYIRHVILCSLLILSLFLFTACGAKINTEMNIDKNFKGERIITALIKSSDLKSYVSTGADGIEETVKNYIPEAMSYKRIDKESGDTEFVFNISFDNVENYTKKIAQILNKNPDNAIQANIIYDNKSNEFKKSILFEENFSSNDLLSWLVYGLKAENKISHSTVSDWMETGTSSLKIDNQDFNVYNIFSVSQSESTSFEKINVLTELLDNGKFERSITFSVHEKNLKILNEKGVVLSEYLKNLSPKDSMFEESKEDKYTNYIVSFETGTSQELCSITDKLFNSQNSVFAINYSSYEDIKNNVKIDLDEYIDASYYLDYDSKKLTSEVYLYDNLFVDYKNTQKDLYMNKIEDKTVFSYSPNFYDTYKFTFSLPIQFQSVNLDIDVNKNKISEKLAMTVSGNLPDSLTKIIENNIKSSIESGKIDLDIKNEENTVTYTLSLKAEPEELSGEFKNFLSSFTGNNVNHEITYNEVESKSKFKTMNSLEIVANLSGLTTESMNFYCKPSTAKKFEILDTSSIEESEKSTNKNVSATIRGGYVRFYALEVGINFVSLIILALFIIILVLVLWYLIAHREKIKALFESIKEKKQAVSTSDNIISIKDNAALTDTNEVSLNQDDEEDEDEFI